MPFGEDSQKGIMQLVGDIVADAALCYKDALIEMRWLQARLESGMYDDEVAYMRMRDQAEDEYWKALFDYQERMDEWKKDEEILRFDLAEKGFLPEDIKKAIYRMLPRPRKPHIRSVPKPRFSHPSYYDEYTKINKVIERERAFFLSDSYSRLCKYDGRDAMADIERIVAGFKIKARKRK